MLSGTLAENLRLGAPDATDAQLAEVLRITRLSRLVARLPDGLATAVPGCPAAGTHAELVASDPLYAELAATQFLASVDTPVA